MNMNPLNRARQIASQIDLRKFAQWGIALLLIVALSIGWVTTYPARHAGHSHFEQSVVHAQYVPIGTSQNTAANGAAGPAGLVAQVSGLLVSVTPGPVYCAGGLAFLHNTQLSLPPSQTVFVAYNCPQDTIYARIGVAGQNSDVLLATVTTSATAVSNVTDNRLAVQFPIETDHNYYVPMGMGPGGCGLYLSTGTLAAAPAGNTNPGMFRVAANNNVYEAISTAATNTVALDCDLTPPTQLTAGKGVTVNNVQILYGVQTTALTSITAPTLNTITYPASGAAANATLASAGGALTLTPGTLQLTTTTSGQCFSENISLATPVILNTDLQRLQLEQLFNQTAAAATQLQICGVIVHYTLIT